MVIFLGKISNFIGGLISMILEIPITRVFGENDHTGMTIGIAIVIIILIGLTIRFLKGGKGD